MIKPTKEELICLYIDENKNMQYIADKFNTNRVIVSRWLKEYKIKIKNPYEKKKIPEKQELENLYLSGVPIEEISKKFNSSERLVSSWLKFYNIEIKDITKPIFDIPDKDTLEKYYNNDNLTIKQISEIFKVSKETIRRWFIKLNIPIESNQKKFKILRAVSFTKDQFDFVIGTMLGDGHLSGTKNKRLFITHCEKQLDYLLYKKEILKNFVNLIYKIERIDKRTNNLYKGWSFTSIVHPTFTKIYNMFYVNNKKIVPKDIVNYLTAFGLAFLVMDDGWLNNKTNIRISTEGFDFEGNKLLSFAIKTNFNIDSKVCIYKRNGKQYCYLSFDVKNSKLLSYLIDPYFIDCMKYKLIRSSTTETLNT